MPRGYAGAPIRGGNGSALMHQCQSKEVDPARWPDQRQNEWAPDALTRDLVASAVSSPLTWEFIGFAPTPAGTRSLRPGADEIRYPHPSTVRQSMRPSETC